MPEEEIIRHMKKNEVGDVYAVQGSIRGKRYHIKAIKEHDYVMLMMTTYGIFEHLEGSDTHKRYKVACGELATKRFNYRKVFGNHFNYRHQVDNNYNRHLYSISVKRTWAKNYWPDRCHY